MLKEIINKKTLIIKSSYKKNIYNYVKVDLTLDKFEEKGIFFKKLHFIIY